jgi:hypothetical protein
MTSNCWCLVRLDSITSYYAFRLSCGKSPRDVRDYFGAPQVALSPNRILTSIIGKNLQSAGPASTPEAGQRYFNLATRTPRKNRMRHPNIPAMPTMILPSREGPFRKASQFGMWLYAIPEMKHARKMIHRIPVWISPGYEESLNRAGHGVTGSILPSRPRASILRIASVGVFWRGPFAERIRIQGSLSTASWR